MDEYIRREAAEKYIENGLNNKNKDEAFGHDTMAEVHRMPAADVVSVREWISVKDRLPEAGGYVVCIAKRNPFSRFMPMVAKIEKNGWVNPITEQYISAVSHWMPIPAADAASVVRCWDCRHAWIHPCGYVYCHRDGRNAYEMTFNLDSFCSYGERKEGFE